jgi:O-antigen/teichoic acid export membrane protein
MKAVSARSMRSLSLRGAGGLASNVVARLGALFSLALATLLVARLGGPAAVGVYALLRVLPSLAGVVLSAGLPGAVTYFLAGAGRTDPRLPSTILAMALVGGGVGAALWALGSPVLARVFFPGLTVGSVAWAGLTVPTQLQVATVKSFCQGSNDMRGANWVILLEEFTFLPAYVAILIVGLRGNVAIIAGLLLADVATFAWTWARIVGRGGFRDAGSPSWPLARTIASYGTRAQVGGVLSLLNLRLDFAILDAIAGPAVLGIYAIASKFAELLKILPMSLTYVLYPKYSGETRSVAAAHARSLLPKAGILVAAAAVPLWIASTYLLPLIYGERFRPAIEPAHILLIGLAAEGVAGVITAFLYGIGRPGLNSYAMGAGVLVTVVLDVFLIPRFGATGAAAASSAAYLTSTAALVAFFFRLARSDRVGPHVAVAQPGVEVS